MSPVNPIIASQNQYAERWQTNSDHFDQQGIYSWMAAQVLKHNPSSLLDIGCGAGNGLLALLKGNPDLSITSLDENRACIVQTDLRLTKQGFCVEKFERLRLELASDLKSYTTLIEGLQPRKSMKITLLQADVALLDAQRDAFLAETSPYDAVTVWLIGAHRCRLFEENAQRRVIDSPMKYRLMIQNDVYSLADKVLRKGGILNIVDREEYTDDPTKRRELDSESLASHRDQASVTSLRIQEHASRSYIEPESKNTVEMVYSSQKSGSIPAGVQMGLFSVTSIKI